MSPLVMAALAVFGVLALLVAYGMWLIGRGSEAEFQARSLAGSSTTFNGGWAFIDWLRNGNIPIVSTVEKCLGIGAAREVYHCKGCRHMWKTAPRSGWPRCPNCGSKQTVPKKCRK